MYENRIEAAAKALFESTRHPDLTWERASDDTRELYRSRMIKNVAAYLAAADKAATITEPEQLAALPAGTRLESQVGPNFDYWNVHGDLLATCLNAAGYVGPVTEIKLPARVIRWGSDV